MSCRLTTLATRRHHTSKSSSTLQTYTFRQSIRLSKGPPPRNNTRSLATSSSNSAPPPAPPHPSGRWLGFLLGSATVLTLQQCYTTFWSSSPIESSLPNHLPVPVPGPVPAIFSNSSKPLAPKINLENALSTIRSAGIEVSIAEEVLSGYATAQGTTYPPSLPLAVVHPRSTEDVVAVVNACRESRVGECSSLCFSALVGYS